MIGLLLLPRSLRKQVKLFYEIYYADASNISYDIKNSFVLITSSLIKEDSDKLDSTLRKLIELVAMIKQRLPTFSTFVL